MMSYKTKPEGKFYVTKFTFELFCLILAP